MPKTICVRVAIIYSTCTIFQFFVLRQVKCAVACKLNCCGMGLKQKKKPKAAIRSVIGLEEHLARIPSSTDNDIIGVNSYKKKKKKARCGSAATWDA